MKRIIKSRININETKMADDDIKEIVEKIIKYISEDGGDKAIRELSLKFDKWSH